MSLKSANKVDTNRVELEVEVDAAAFEDAVNKAYKKNIRRMNVPGFRKGQGAPPFGGAAVRRKCILRGRGQCLVPHGSG